MKSVSSSTITFTKQTNIINLKLMKTGDFTEKFNLSPVTEGNGLGYEITGKEKDSICLHWLKRWRLQHNSWHKK